MVLSCDRIDNLQLMLKCLQNNEVVLSASDTVLGLFAQLSEKSKKKLDLIKQRNIKPYIILLSSTSCLDAFIEQELDENMKNIMMSYWPGPLTIVFRAKSILPDWLKSQQDTIAIRIPSHEGLQKIIQSIGGLFTTSANISDQPLPKKFSEINLMLLKHVYVYDCDQDAIYDGIASTIIDFSHNDIRILRQGTVQIDSI